MPSAKSSSSRLDQVIDQISIKVNKTNKLQNVQQPSSQQSSTLPQQSSQQLPCQPQALLPLSPPHQSQQLQSGLEAATTTTTTRSSSASNIFISEQTEDCFENSFFTMALDPLCGKDSAIVDFSSAAASLVDDVGGGGGALLTVTSTSSSSLPGAEKSSEKTETLCAVEALIECSDSRSLGHFGEIVKSQNATPTLNAVDGSYAMRSDSGLFLREMTTATSTSTATTSSVAMATTSAEMETLTEKRPSCHISSKGKTVKFVEDSKVKEKSQPNGAVQPQDDVVTLTNVTSWPWNGSENVVALLPTHPQQQQSLVAHEKLSQPQQVTISKEKDNTPADNHAPPKSRPSKNGSSSRFLKDSSTSRRSSPICDVCGKTYSSNSKLRKHRETVHEGKTVPCPICGKEMKVGPCRCVDLFLGGDGVKWVTHFTRLGTSFCIISVFIKDIQTGP